MKKIALIGGPGSGKTTLALGFVSHMKHNSVPWAFVSEYARDYIESYGKDAPAKGGDFTQMLFLKKQQEREQRVHPSYGGFVTDSPVFLAWVYAAKYTSMDFTGRLAKVECYKAALSSLSSYSAICWVRREKPYMQDSARIQTLKEVEALDNFIAEFVRNHGIPLIEIRGDEHERIAALKAVCYPGKPPLTTAERLI
jgi:nicotinamide riboside kinase